MNANDKTGGPAQSTGCPRAFAPDLTAGGRIVDAPAAAGASPYTLQLTVLEVRRALQAMADESPAHAHLAAIARAMLVRLDTIRDEARLRACLAADRIDAGDTAGALEALESLRTMCGQRGDRHALAVEAPPRAVHSKEETR